MCVELPGTPLGLPRLRSLAGFKVVDKRDGLHVGRGGFTYPFGTLRLDPNAVLGDHERCLHFAFDHKTAERNLLGSYGSHLILCALLPGHFWSKQGERGNCLHGDLTVPLGCYTCGEGDVRLRLSERAAIDSMLRALPRNELPTWARLLPVVSG